MLIWNGVIVIVHSEDGLGLVMARLLDFIVLFVSFVECTTHTTKRYQNRIADNQRRILSIIDAGAKRTRLQLGAAVCHDQFRKPVTVTLRLR